MTRTNPNHLDRNHPVRAVLELARSGAPTSATLDRFLKRDDLPDGQSLDRFRRELATAGAEVARLHRHGDRVGAQRYADGIAGRIAQRMTDEEAAVTGDTHPPEDVRTAGARMFEN